MPGEVVRSIPATWPVADGFIYSHVRTDHPGYRQIQIGGITYTVASGIYRWDEFIAAVTDALNAAPAQFELANTGQVSFDPDDTVPVRYPDRLGWLLGLARDAGTSEVGGGNFTSTASRFVPPGGIPLMAMSWSEVVVEAEVKAIVDASRRIHGHTFGSARIWRVPVTLTRWALEALRTGWCLRSEVTIVGSDLSTTPMSSSAPNGALNGYILGIEGSVEWLDPQVEYIAKATLVVAGTA